MKKTILLLLLFLLFLLVGKLSHGQGGVQPFSPGEFTAFASRQDSLFTDAYNRRDLSQYHRLLTIFLEKFNRLSTADQKSFAGYRSVAYYNLACTYGILGQKKAALDYLEKAIEAGYSNFNHLVVDGDLVSVRGEERWRRLIAPLRRTGDFMYILRKAARYNNHDHRPLPSYIYASTGDPHLAALRDGLRLDSIAGGGSDVSRVLNLLHWMHDLVPHDGNHENPVVRNAMSLIAVCKKEKRGLNCRGLAIALNECYLALGYPAKYITCLPKDSLGVDPDCHVINVVYLSSLQKWVWIDPTNDAYVMNENGQLLGPEEVRRRLITHQPLIVNPDANWNHRSAVVKEEYLYNYMAKNLYMLQCPVNSGYDLETRAEGKEYAYIQLLPLDYFRQGPDTITQDYGAGKGRLLIYHTNNAREFWAAPK